MSTNYDSLLNFEKNEKQLTTQLIIQLQTTLKQYAPNAPIVKTTAEYLRQRRNATLQDFSQTKLQEFYAPLSFNSGVTSLLLNSTQSQVSPLNSADILVPESQSTVGGKRPNLSGSLPSQISPTQTLSFDFSLPQPMDTYSGPSSEQTIREAESSQTQDSRLKWNSIRAVLEHKLCSDQKQLNQLFFECNKEFDDHWIRDNQQINDWTTSLSELTEELGLNIQPIVNF